MTVGIIGSGAIGTAFARTLARVGIRATIANSRGPDSLQALVHELGPSIKAGTARKRHAPRSFSSRSTGRNCRRR